MILLRLFVSIFFISCSQMKYWPDSPIEEFVEEIVADKTGIFVDLSGNNPDPSLTQIESKTNSKQGKL